jgi:protein arginine N-methyltransferase 1
MVDPPKVDVVVSETLGNYALEEHVVETLADAKKRFLKPGGVLIPRRIEQFVAPVISDRVQAEFSAWDTTGFDLSVAKAMSLNNIYVRTFSTKELFEAKSWDTIDLGTDGRSARKGEASWKLKAATTVYGFATWWNAELAPRIMLSTAPDARRTHWEQLYFPLLQPIAAKAGDTIVVNLRSRTSADAGTHVAWVATHRDAKGREAGRQSLNLDKGFLP